MFAHKDETIVRVYEFKSIYTNMTHFEKTMDKRFSVTTHPLKSFSRRMVTASPWEEKRGFCSAGANDEQRSAYMGYVGVKRGGRALSLSPRGEQLRFSFYTHFLYIFLAGCSVDGASLNYLSWTSLPSTKEKLPLW